jgi:hypothetical protein
LLGILENLDLADAALVTGRKPEIPDLDAALRTDDTQHVVLLRHDRA